MKGRRKPRPGARVAPREQIPEPSVQLEELPARLENPYHRAIAAIGRAIPLGLLAFVVVTGFEASTGRLGYLAVTAWLERLHRLPGVVSGQGNLSADSIVSAASAYLERHPTRLLMVGDSVLAPNLGGGALSELALGEMAAQQVPGTLNLGHEGAEWATVSFLIEDILAEHARRPGSPALPALLIDINPKFFTMPTSFTPSILIEVEACSRRAAPGEDPAAREAICASLSSSWPTVLRTLSSWSPSLLRGLLGQFDFFMTFALRAPIYHGDLGLVNHAGLGRNGIRAFRSGLADAGSITDDLREHPPVQPPPPNYRIPMVTDSVNQYEDAISGNFAAPNQPKHAWLDHLAHVVARWPAPVYAIYVRPSPAMEEVLSAERAQAHAAIRERIYALFSGAARATGKGDLRMVDNHDFAPLPTDYADHDHFSPDGNVKFAEYLNRNLAGGR